LNYKKGIFRLFIIGLVLAPILAMFMNGDRYMKYRMDSFDSQQYAVAAAKMPRCAAIVAKNPIKFPDLNYEPENNCLSLVMNWDEIKAYQAKQGNISSPVTDKVIRDAMQADTNDVVASMRLMDSVAYVIFYLAFSLITLVVFFIGKWVVKGFKS
jgi:hypothetical protein